MKTGIYQIRNRHDGKIYIGSAAGSFEQRWSLHKSRLRRNVHGNHYLQNAWNKYGEESFDFSILTECPPEECLAAEQVWFNVMNPDYNLCPIAWSSRGRPMSEETRRKYSENSRGEKNSFYGRKHSDETKAKIAATREALGINKRVSEKLKGHAVSEETRRKISEIQRGRKQSPETVAKRKASMKTVLERKRAAKAAAA